MAPRGDAGAFDFIQSHKDTPCRVTGETYGRNRTPVLSMSKWDREAGLLFKTEFPGERVRHTEHSPGRTVLTTNKRRHVYRRLDGGNVEYDIILPEVPDSPEFKIPLEMPRGLSFYRQGTRWGSLMGDEVKGSYAVYWKRRGKQYRTGKFCHIYRPKIIDAAGSWVWGQLDFDGDALYITVDEDWLKTARYPVTVDPRLGSDSVGAGRFDFINDEPGMPTVDLAMAMQRHVVEEPIAGACTTYYYSYKNDYEAGGYSVLYDGAIPTNLVSSNAPFVNLRVPSGESYSWKSSSFEVEQEQPAGNYVWFGLMAKYYYYPYFDEIEGADLRLHYPSSFDAPPAVCGTTYRYRDILLSQYFDYVVTTTWNVKIIGRIKPDEELLQKGEYQRLHEDNQDISEGIGASRGILRMIENLTALSDAFALASVYKRLTEDFIDAADQFSRSFTSFIKIIEGWSVWDIFHPYPSHASEELTIYSPITQSLDLKSSI